MHDHLTEIPDRSSVPNFHTINVQTGEITPGIKYAPGDFRGARNGQLFLPLARGARNPQTRAGRVTRGRVTALGLAGPCGYGSCEAGSTEDPGKWCEVLYAPNLPDGAGPFFVIDSPISASRVSASALTAPGVFEGKTPARFAYVDGQVLVVDCRAYFMDGERRLKACDLRTFLATVRAMSATVYVDGCREADEGLRAVGNPVTYPAAS